MMLCACWGKFYLGSRLAHIFYIFTQVCCVSGVFPQQIFTIHSLRCSFARNRWKDSSPRTVLAFLYPRLPSTPQRRRLTNCTSALGKTPHLHNFFHVCACWHVTRGTRGHRVTKKRRTPQEIWWSSSRTSNNNPVSSFFFWSRPESTPAATVVKHFVTSHILLCIRAIGFNKYLEASCANRCDLQWSAAPALPKTLNSADQFSNLVQVLADLFSLRGFCQRATVKKGYKRKLLMCGMPIWPRTSSVHWACTRPTTRNREWLCTIL